ncbi:predicted protein [Uncinocarpus reesii 1704]|uniref:Uncharacterized protein n=1 Tax=Uncinocarpus reesii (strain UAMH 1704) TaxID=336963 RepID=C4JNL4_UNCRE|nr:uncharacterized protein UREG_03012 [Uncinocarpus reesii 1704]EEP78167.1 predicted protein [Uncinocarpus reesii 1704]
MAPFECLSVELLGYICDYVASGYKPSVDCEKLSEDLDRWNHILQESSGFGCVRQLEIGPRADLVREGDEKFSVHDNNLDFGGQCHSPVISKRDDEWKPEPLARFLIQLPALRDIVYRSDYQFSPFLLDTLHRSLPRCRLHFLSFHLCSLIQHRDRLQDVDPHEYAIATSPSLHCITLTHYPFNTDGLLNYNDVALRKIVAGLAPNLKRVQLFSVHPGSSPQYVNAFRMGRPKWPGFFQGHPSQATDIGNLEVLDLRFGILDLEDWARYTALSSLHVLKTNCEIRSLDMLRWASGCKFTSLKVLELNLTSIHEVQNEFMDATASIFLESLLPLESLGLTGFFGHETFQVILNHHSSLYKIRLLPHRDTAFEPFVLTAGRIGELMKRCPLLKEATLLVPRTQGDTEEVNIYRMLGSIARLTNITLHLDSSDYSDPRLHNRFSVPLEYDPDLQAMVHPEEIKSQARRALINAAVDEPLARSIYQEIIQAQAQHGKPVLQRLKLQVIGDGDFGGGVTDGDLIEILNVISCNWEFIKNPSQRDDRDDDVVVKKLSPRNSERADMLYDPWENTGRKMSFYQQIFRKIWPERTNHWTNDWHSLPLVLG